MRTLCCVLVTAALVGCTARPRTLPGGVSGTEPPPLPALVQLAELGVKARPFVAPARRLPDGEVCEVPDGVTVLRGATGLRFSKPPQVNGAFALRLARFEAVLQEEAQLAFGQRVRRLEHVGAFTCRFIAGTQVASQHARGNALDVAAFVLANGRRISVKRHFARAGTPPTTDDARFLRRLVDRVLDERLFGSVLTPDFDRAHAGHLHLDGRQRRLFWWAPRG